MMIQNINGVSFGALIKIKDPETYMKQAAASFNQLPVELKASSGSGMTTLSGSISTGVPLSNTAATGSDVVGSAFMLKHSGVDSFGIVPSAMDKSASVLTPETIVASGEHPSTAGSIFSTIGGWVHSHAKLFETQKKIPS